MPVRWFAGMLFFGLSSSAFAQPVWTSPAEPASNPEPSPSNLSSSAVQLNLPATTGSRGTAVQLFKTVHEPALAVPIGFSGNVATCDAGDTSAAYADATIGILNYYRRMAGLVNPVTEDPASSAAAQQAALMMEAAGAISHSPYPDWPCYSEAGANAAAASNLALYVSGPSAIRAYVQDQYIPSLGHRRWVLYPPLTGVGIGSTPYANALQVFGPSLWGPRPEEPDHVAWPPAGFIPYPVVYSDWSFSLNGLSLAGASVAMHHEGVPVPLTFNHLPNGTGDPTIAWEPAGIVAGKGMDDETYDVTISNVTVGEDLVDFRYQVTLIDPSKSGCAAPTDILEMPYTQTTVMAEYQACEWISAMAGLEVLAGSDLLLYAPRVTLGPGFSVAHGATVTVVSGSP